MHITRIQQRAPRGLAWPNRLLLGLGVDGRSVAFLATIFMPRAAPSKGVCGVFCSERHTQVKSSQGRTPLLWVANYTFNGCERATHNRDHTERHGSLPSIPAVSSCTLDRFPFRISHRLRADMDMHRGRAKIRYDDHSTCDCGYISRVIVATGPYTAANTAALRQSAAMIVLASPRMPTLEPNRSPHARCINLWPALVSS
jgi:hypothetical protein